MDIPVEMATLFNEVVGETGHLLQTERSVLDMPDDGSSTGGSQIHGEEIGLFIHLNFRLISRFAGKGTSFLIDIPLLFDF